MLRYIAIVGVGLIVAIGSVQATPLIPGQSGFPDVFTQMPGSPEVTQLAYTSGNWTVPPSPGGGGGASGTYATAVYRDDDGDLDFVYQFTNNAGSQANVTETSGLSFSGWSPVDVGYITNGSALPGGGFVNGSVGPAGIPTQVDFQSNGSVVDWQFSPPTSHQITPGTTSVVLIVRTEATHFTTGIVGIIAGSTDNVMGYQPAMVPEPALFLPLGAGLLALVGLRRRLTRSA